MRLFALSVLTVAVVAACENRAAVQAGSPTAGAFDPQSWRAPADSEIPNDSLGASIRRGLALVIHTPDSLPRYAPGRITCSNCHLQAGRNPDAAPLTGSHARFPKYMDRTGAVITLADRVNYCFTRSLSGTRIPADSREMGDILAYIAFLSKAVPVGRGSELPGSAGIALLATNATGDKTSGAQVFAAKCVSCHGPNGEGNPAIPPGVPALWGERSFTVGASMARQTKAASFIWHNMPFGAGQTLTQQEALDVAAYVTSQPRPDSPGKEDDWPTGGAPEDVPYATQGHAAYLPPPVLPRKNPAGAIVPKPALLSRSSTR